MKNLFVNIVVILLLSLPSLLFGQSEQVQKLFDKYSGSDGFTSVEVTKGLFELFAEVEADDPEFDDFKKAIDGLESLKLLAYSMKDENADPVAKEDFISEVKSTISFKEYQELMVVKDSDANINFYAKSEKQIIKEMLMVVDGKDEAVLLSMFGDLDLNYLAKLGTTMDMGGIHYLGRMKQNE
jgi:hypothetical protein